MKKLLLALATAWGIALLLIAYQFAQNGRYQPGPIAGGVIDTRTGALYKKNYQTGRLKLDWAAPEK